ncbi:helix-turn-helix domain-containing protein [Bacillus inaquosorum]|uniref:helix-turn-helix domain-containing protein n=1 Tax=Bacillus inaquosorum TaxID=483913 RepID=UPI002DBE0522|nr:helix-turn-helix domain-containing protein [Bacillus inaquosorum]MEC2062595.1 helix-turn-helix domain-containing protein [Bacillus inaquosorum]MEC2086262.1 helix-turn-helix domain-containing protein [Bacillus inaquosorum]
MSKTEEFNLAAYIKQIRINRNITQSKLAELADLTVSYISQLESGKRKNPSQKTFKKIAVALSIPTIDVVKVTNFSSDANSDNNLKVFDVSGLESQDIQHIESQIELLKIKNKYKEICKANGRIFE